MEVGGAVALDAPPAGASVGAAGAHATIVSAIEAAQSRVRLGAPKARAGEQSSSSREARRPGGARG